MVTHPRDCCCHCPSCIEKYHAPAWEQLVREGLAQERGDDQRANAMTDWAVLDYDGEPLPDHWQSEAEAVDKGLCGKYLLSGYEVVVWQGKTSNKWRSMCGLCSWSSPPYWGIDVAMFDGDHHHDKTHPSDVHRHTNVKLTRVLVVSGDGEWR